MQMSEFLLDVIFQREHDGKGLFSQKKMKGKYVKL